MSPILDSVARTVRGRAVTGEGRAVGDLIATVLLVAIVVGIAGSLAVTVDGMASGQLGGTQQVMAQLVDAMRAACDDASLTCSFD